jgi:putative ABC transport system substrate-binding protein
MTYGPGLPDLYRRSATYVDKRLKGANPAELPIERPTKVALVTNLKTAKAFVLTISPSLLIPTAGHQGFHVMPVVGRRSSHRSHF